MRPLLLLAFAACAPEPALEGADLLPSQAPPPPAMSLAVDPLGVGVPATLTATGAPAGSTVTWVLSTSGFGTFCPGWLPGNCLGIRPVVTILGRATADASGRATISFTPTPRAADRRYGVQAVVQASGLVSNAVPAWVAPAGFDLSPGADVDLDGVTRGEGDCHDGDPTIAPGLPDAPGDFRDVDCDGTDGADFDRDGVLAPESGGTDCDDRDPTTAPGFAERCDFVDNDCDGVIDQGLPDTDGSGLEDCKEVAVVVTWGFTAHDLAFWTCDNSLPIARELAELEAAITSTGLGMVRIDEDEVNGVDAAALAPYGAVIVHNGGWADELRAPTVDALLATSTKPLMFIGDDIGFMASRTDTITGRPELWDLTHIGAYTHNGNEAFRGLGADLVNPDHPVAQGPFGTAASFAYNADFDHVTLAGDGEVVLMAKVNVGSPVAWVAQEPLRRMAVVMPSAYNNNLCPVSDVAGLDDISSLLANSLWWVMDLP